MTLFIKGRSIGCCKDEAPWDDYKSSVRLVILIKGVREIGENSFQGLDKLARISILFTFTLISSNSFTNCEKLEQKDVSEENEIYSIKEGVLFNLYKIIFIAFHPSKSGSHRIPDGVEEIGDRDFFGCPLLEGIIFPYSARKKEYLHLMVAQIWIRWQSRDSWSRHVESILQLHASDNNLMIELSDLERGIFEDKCPQIV